MKAITTKTGGESAQRKESTMGKLMKLSAFGMAACMLTLSFHPILPVMKQIVICEYCICFLIGFLGVFMSAAVLDR